MTTPLAQAAFALWVETLNLEAVDINTESARWHDLYSKECELFNLMRQFTPEDSIQYRALIKEHHDSESNWDEVCEEWGPVDRE